MTTPLGELTEEERKELRQLYASQTRLRWKVVWKIRGYVEAEFFESKEEALEVRLHRERSLEQKEDFVKYYRLKGDYYQDLRRFVIRGPEGELLHFVGKAPASWEMAVQQKKYDENRREQVRKADKARRELGELHSGELKLLRIEGKSLSQARHILLGRHDSEFNRLRSALE